MGLSLAQQLDLNPRLKAHYLSQLPQDFLQRVLPYRWDFWARPEQIAPPGDWIVWLILAGRGFGKTRGGGEWVRGKIKAGFNRISLIGATVDDARDIMIEGESGILAICPKDERPVYKRNERKLIWPNGAVSHVFTADEPERARGKQHEGVWADELAAWRYPDAWDQMLLGLRLGRQPQACVTTTPRPTPIIKGLVNDPTTIVTTGSTFDNEMNLAEAFINKITQKFQGTRLGQQELYAKILDDNPDALWQRAMIERFRVRRMPEKLKRIVVAVDPQAGLDGAETGIVTVGVDGEGHGFVLADDSLRASPNEWGTQAILAYETHKADRIIGEENQGGKMVEHVLRTIDPKVSYKGVRAMVGKRLRAEPVAAMYEQGRVHHVGTFGTLEDQMCEWTPGEDSPDHLDALVWGLTELMLQDTKSRKGYGL